MLISARPWKLVVLVGGLVATVAGSGILAWLVFDQHYGDRYIFAGLPPGQRIPNKWLESDVIVKADTLEELARKGRPARRRVEATVERFNGFAESGTGSGTRCGSGLCPSDPARPVHLRHRMQCACRHASRRRRKQSALLRCAVRRRCVSRRETAGPTFGRKATSS
jgi:hypothetical protein